MPPKKDGLSPAEHIDKLIAETTDWRSTTLAGVRKAILAADKGIVEEWKWMGSPSWECDGILVVGNAHKKHVKLTFANGAHLEDADKIFNNGFNGNKWRSIDYFEGDKVDAPGLTKLIKRAVEFNRSKSKAKPSPKTASAKTAPKTAVAKTAPKPSPAKRAKAK